MGKDVTKSLLHIVSVVMILIGSSAAGIAQSDILKKRITLKVQEQPLRSVLDTITSKYGIDFSYNSKIARPVFFNNVDIVNASLNHALFGLLNEHALGYKESSGVIIIFKKSKEPTLTSAQSKKGVYGYLTNKATGKPIASVNVFISNTTIGTSTNAEGFYRMSTSESGPQELIFSHINYFPVIESIQLDSQDDVEISLTMTEKVKKLKEVVIKGSKEEWEKRLKIFEKEFLGSTPNASVNKILNPWVLDFEYDVKTGKLEATAQDLLVIENKALGYKVSHLLKFFEYKNGITRYLTKVKFEEITPRNESKRKNLDRKRREAYEGSFRHFLSALVNEDLKRQGFKIAVVNSFEKNRIKSAINGANVLQNKGKYQQLLFSGFLEVTYVDKEEIAYQRYLVEKNGTSVPNGFYKTDTRPQISFLQIVDYGIGPRIISGKLKNPMSVVQHGYWAWKRTSDLVPSDFTPYIKK